MQDSISDEHGLCGELPCLSLQVLFGSTLLRSSGELSWKITTFGSSGSLEVYRRSFEELVHVVERGKRL